MANIMGFEAVYVVSDLHIGGAPETYLLREPLELSSVIDKATAEASGRPTALVLNGDVFDFLAVDRPHTAPSCFDPTVACQRLALIFGLPETALDAQPIGHFAPLLQALRSYVSKPSATLVVVIGNHDIELAMGSVQQRLLDILVPRGEKNDELARRRVLFATDGTGFRFSVGKVQVLCVHGNDQDSWNIVDHEALRRAQARERAGYALVPDDVPANAGTRLVLEVMNEIKCKHAFVDLLKPEQEAVLPALLAFGTRANITTVGSIMAQRQLMRLRLATGLTRGTLSRPSAPDDAPRLVGDEGDDERVLRGGELYAEVEALYGENVEPLALVQGVETLSLSDYMVDRFVGFFTGTSSDMSLENTLNKELAKDHSFDLDGPDEVLDALAPKVSDDIHVLITGHTHLARFVTRPRKSGAPNPRYYVNTGTWIGLISLHKDRLGLLSMTVSNAIARLRASTTIDSLGNLVFSPSNYVVLEATEQQNAKLKLFGRKLTSHDIELLKETEVTP